jgi:spermidine synthase
MARGVPRASSFSRRRLAYLLLLPIFFASGFAALLYQMIWQRLLTFFSGADVHSVTLIVAAFMCGLGLGSLAGGHLADRLRPAQRYLAFALAELAVAAFALASTPLIYDVLFLRLGERALPPPLVAGVLFASLLWPTFFMGLSLPLLSRVVSEDLDVSAERIGGLYGWNTLGAAVGALVTVWVLVRLVGFEGAIRVGAAVNAACAVGALGVAALGRGGEAPAASSAAGASRPPARLELPAPMPLSLGSWLSLYALSGFVALSLEIVWFRILGIVLKSNSFTFATLLAIYLAGLGVGALLGARLAKGSRRPAAAFCALQASIGLYASLSMAVLVFGLGHFGFLDILRSYLGQEEALKLGDAVPATVRYLLRGGHVAPYARHLTHVFLTLYAGLPLVLFGPGTLFMGMSFPFLQKAVQTDLARLGRRVGWLQAANIVGSTLGAALTGLGLLHWLGTAWTLRLLAALAGVFLLLFARLRFSSRRGRAIGSLVAAAAALLVAVASPSPETLWSRLHGTTPDRVVFVEDGSGLSLLKDVASEKGKPATAFHVHGLGQSHLPFGSYHTVLGALPVLIHPRPVEVAVIGLGSGDTVFGIAGRAETERIDCIEIVHSELEALRRRAARRDYPGLERLFRDGRVRYFFTDGRTFLMRGKRRYDVIEADALWPDSAYSGNLYSLEYFRLLRDRLKPGGYAVTWSPTPRVRDTFARVFPYVLALGSTLIGSDSPVPLAPESVRARLKERFTAAHYALGEVDIGALVSDALLRPPEVWTPGSDRTTLTDVNTDLFPKDEYLVSFALWPR